MTTHEETTELEGAIGEDPDPDEDVLSDRSRRKCYAQALPFEIEILKDEEVALDGIGLLFPGQFEGWQGVFRGLPGRPPVGDDEGAGADGHGKEQQERQQEGSHRWESRMTRTGAPIHFLTIS